jgi:hypothetical protein
VYEALSYARVSAIRQELSPFLSLARSISVCVCVSLSLSHTHAIRQIPEKVVSASGGEKGGEERRQWGGRGATASEPTAAATGSEANGREASGRGATGREAPADALPWEGKTGSKRVRIQVLSLLALLVQSTNTDT